MDLEDAESARSTDSRSERICGRRFCRESTGQAHSQREPEHLGCAFCKLFLRYAGVQTPHRAREADRSR
eukprot:7378752-Prymnesium_polylepis.2